MKGELDDSRVSLGHKGGLFGQIGGEGKGNALPLPSPQKVEVGASLGQEIVVVGERSSGCRFSLSVVFFLKLCFWDAGPPLW